MIDYTPLIELIRSAFVDITIFNIGWILSIPLVIGTSILITRDKGAWGILYLPLTIMYYAIGVKPSIVWLLLIAIVFAMRIFSIDIVGNIVRTNVEKGLRESDIYKNKQKRKALIGELNEELQRRKKKKLKSISDEKLRDDLTKAIKKGGLFR